MTTRALLSRSDGSDEEIDLTGWASRAIADNELLWVDAEQPTDEERQLIARALGVDATLFSALDRQQGRPNATVLDEGIVVSIRSFVKDRSEPAALLHIVVGSGWALTWHDEPIPFVDEHYRRIQDQRDIGDLTPVLLLVAMLDWHVDTFFAGAEELAQEVDQLDEDALRGEKDDVLERLVATRQRISDMRRLISANQEVFAEIGRPDFLPDLRPDEAESLTYVSHRLERAIEAVTNARDMLLGSFDVHMTRTAQRTNDIMRVLTLVSVMLLPAGVIAGVMGMNFQVGFFDTPTMFWLVLAVMALLMVLTLFVARWRRWL